MGGEKEAYTEAGETNDVPQQNRLIHTKKKHKPSTYTLPPPPRRTPKRHSPGQDISHESFRVQLSFPTPSVSIPISRKEGENRSSTLVEERPRV